ncbi:transmembrane and coiled-coil domain-containing protein 6 isoform X3 [Poeciliopsis prolifica]|uniref:transmembrane and coiled-coil domain-containing protein 6 isoform X1 n=1 Tax=Poeciliopsis prolifica TaxID=188132 RepID=UPI002413320A|nr:transmembrane and coiled-coil domain-containing protein 6 isoform X1 [Poeciliopsis prolifica]XP_054890390.1 transmembrane and coiled-coil domain-containing protein 6 isoform X3 [Poeciliopsis prolifica]
MWRLNKVRHKAGGHANNQEELRTKRREKERALRQARRDRQLVSKRLLLNEDEEQDTMEVTPGEQDLVNLFQKLQHGGTEKEAFLRPLSKALRNPSAQLTFIKLENSMHLLVGLLTGSDARCRLQAVRCLHELSHSTHTSVASACLPATPYLLTYLSGQSTKFTELCLYTLGNICPDSERVKERLLAQGIIPALASCIQNHRHNLAVMEAAGFALFQLLQSKDAALKVIPAVLASSLPSQLLSVLTPDPDFGLAPAIECAWCLHSLTSSSSEDHRELLALGALRQCGSLLVSLGGAVAAGNTHQGMELLVCPLLRCVGNLLSSCPAEALHSQLVGADLVAPLCELVVGLIHTLPALAREIAWVLNNLTAHSTESCSALLTLNLVPRLLELLSFSKGINTMVLRVLANVAHKKKEFCIQLAELGLLSALTATLKMADQDMVTLSLEVLFMMIVSSPQIAEQFVSQGGLSVLEAIQYNSDGEVRRRAAYLLEQHVFNEK